MASNFTSVVALLLLLHVAAPDPAVTCNSWHRFCLSPPPCPLLIRHVLFISCPCWLSVWTSRVFILLSWSVELLFFCIEAYYFANSFLNYDVSKYLSQSKNTNWKELLAQLLRRIDARSLAFLDLPGNVIKLWLLIWFLFLNKPR